MLRNYFLAVLGIKLCMATCKHFTPPPLFFGLFRSILLGQKPSVQSWILSLLESMLLFLFHYPFPHIGFYCHSPQNKMGGGWGGRLVNFLSDADGLSSVIHTLWCNLLEEVEFHGMICDCGSLYVKWALLLQRKTLGPWFHKSQVPRRWIHWCLWREDWDFWRI